jgi:hypothetical protein
MHLSRSLLLVAAGVALGALLVLSCGDDAPTDADAAAPVCDCPAAEAPLSADRFEEKEQTVTIPAGETVTSGLVCDAPAIFWSGGCDVQGTTPVDSFLTRSLPSTTTGWQCTWKNPGGNEDTGIVRIVCLNPAP